MAEWRPLGMSTLGRFRRYPRYKDSGVEWLGEIPAHWELAPVYARYEVALGKMLDAKRVTGEFSGRYLRNVDVQWDAVNTDNLPEMDFAPRERDRYSVRPGDLLVCEGGEVGRTAIWPGEIAECFYQKALHRVRPRAERETPRFFYYLMYMVAKRGVFAGSGNQNTIDHLTAIQLKHYRFPFAPAAEQRAIAAFLDRETARINALVAKKERLIKLLQEQRASLITSAVTKGLDPNVPMKDSGIEWLGEIPAHWKLKRLRHVGEAIIGLTYQPDDVVGPEEGILVLRASNVSNGRVVYVDTVFVRSAIPEHLRTRLGDILICARSGSRDLIGKNAKIDEAAVGLTFGTFMLVFRSPDNPFLFYAFNSALFEYQSGTFLTSTINQLTVGNLKDMTVAVPPGKEQATIAAFLDRETTRIDGLVAKVRDAIEHLKELRIALISAAVTGKIDVREEAA
jgi:type I restriction enzyme, S subunit